MIQSVVQSVIQKTIQARSSRPHGASCGKYVGAPLCSIWGPAETAPSYARLIAHLQVFGQPYIITYGGGPGYASYTVINYLYQEAVRYLHAGYASAIAIGLASVMIVLTLLQFMFLGRQVESD